MIRVTVNPASPLVDIPLSEMPKGRFGVITHAPISAPAGALVGSVVLFPYQPSSQLIFALSNLTYWRADDKGTAKWRVRLIDVEAIEITERSDAKSHTY